jgi:hypothetical protein
MMISFTTTKDEHRLITQIADRASAMGLSVKPQIEYPRTDAAMDIIAVHANGCPLRLDALLAAEPFDFAHDVFGIRRHLNRETGQLEHCFTPRYARVQ